VTDEPALFLIGHGTRSSDGVAQLRAFVDAVARERPDHLVGSGFIEFAEPELAPALDDLVALGARHIVAVPLVLLGAGHMKDDGPAALAGLRRRHRHVSATYARDLGVHPTVLAVAEERIRAAGGGAPNCDAVVVVGRGSSDPDANADLAKVARLLADRRGLGTAGSAGALGLVEPAFVSLAPPDVAAALDKVALLGARTIVVAPYFLFTGILLDRIRDQAAAWAGAHRGVTVTVAEELGVDHRLVDHVWARFDESLAGATSMNCDGCLYRAPIPGYEDRVGSPPFG